VYRLLKGVKISISTDRNVDNEFIPGYAKIIDINLLVTHALFGLEYRQTSLTLICLSLMPSGCVEYRQISLTLISRTGSYSSSYICSQKLAMIKIIITKAQSLGTRVTNVILL
jgi:hypothetical protein